MDTGRLAGLINMIYPSSCPACGSGTDNTACAPFCKACWSGITRYSGPACKVCSVPFSSKYASVCSDCLKKPPAFTRALSYGIYENVLASAIGRFKFQGARRLHKPLGKFLLELEMPAVDAIVPVPLSLTGLLSRGFNQALLLSKIVSRHHGIPMITDGLLKVKDTPSQIGLSARERAINLKGSFITVRDFRSMKLLVVDDVMTTGATARECSGLLLKTGAEEVYVMTLARAAAG